MAFHGAQVAVGTIFAAIAWDIVLNELDPKTVDVDKCFPAAEAMEPVVREAFSWISDTAAEECWSRYQKKLSAWHGQKEALRKFLDDWDSFRDEVRSRLVTAEYLTKMMHEAGCPTRYSQMTPAIDAKTGRWAVRDCHLYRNRFTLVDFLYYIGWWNDAFLDRVISRAAELDAGL